MTLRLKAQVIINDGMSLVILYENFIEDQDSYITYQTIFNYSAWTNIGKRDTIWIGDIPYSYTGKEHKANTCWPLEIATLRDKLNKLFSARINSVLCNRYKSGMN